MIVKGSNHSDYMPWVRCHILAIRMCTCAHRWSVLHLCVPKPRKHTMPEHWSNKLDLRLEVWLGRYQGPVWLCPQKIPFFYQCLYFGCNLFEAPCSSNHLSTDLSARWKPCGTLVFEAHIFNRISWDPYEMISSFQKNVLKNLWGSHDFHNIKKLETLHI